MACILSDRSTAKPSDADTTEREEVATSSCKGSVQKSVQTLLNMKGAFTRTGTLRSDGCGQPLHGFEK
jgi:hypothetical protein